MKHHAIKICFNDVTEFLEELAASEPLDPPILRLTQRFSSSSLSPTIKHVTVVAGFLKIAGDVLQLVELETYCGDHWGKDFPHSEETIKRAEAKMDAITTKLRDGNLLTPPSKIEVRAGSYELPNEK